MTKARKLLVRRTASQNGKEMLDRIPFVARQMPSAIDGRQSRAEKGARLVHEAKLLRNAVPLLENFRKRGTIASDFAFNARYKEIKGVCFRATALSLLRFDMRDQGNGNRGTDQSCVRHGVTAAVS